MAKSLTTVHRLMRGREELGGAPTVRSRYYGRFQIIDAE